MTQTDFESFVDTNDNKNDNNLEDHFDIPDDCQNETNITSIRFGRRIWKSVTNIDQRCIPVITMMSDVKIKSTAPYFSFPYMEKSSDDDVKIVGDLFDYALTGKMPDEKIKKKCNQKHNVVKKDSAEQIKLKNSMQKIKEKIDKINTYFNPQTKLWDFNARINSLFDSLEINAYVLLKIIEYFEYFYNHDLEEKTYEIIIIAYRFLDMLKNNNQFSSLLKTKLSDQLEKLEIKTNYEPKNVLNKFKRLTVYNKYEYILPNTKGLRPMDHQIELLTSIMESFYTTDKNKKNFFRKYTVMAGYGKTTTVVAIGKLFQEMNKLQTYSKNRIRLVFACNIDSVRLEVIKMLHYTGITYGNVAYKETGDKTARYWDIRQYQGREVLNPTVLITGPEFAFDVIKYFESKGEHIVLFYDEPTVGADNPTSIYIKDNAKLLLNLPGKTILSSATFPEKIDTILNLHEIRFPGINLSLPSISCTDVKIGCQTFTFNQTAFPIYSGIKNKTELQQLSSAITSNPFLKRMCTFETLESLHNLIIKHNVRMNFDFNAWKKNISNMNPNSISLCALELLKMFSNLSDSCIASVFQIGGDKNNTKIKMDELLNKWTLQMDGMTLIASKNPVDFVKHNFSAFIDTVNSKYDIRAALEKYDLAMEKYEKLLEDKRKAEETAAKKVLVKDEGGNVIGSTHLEGGLEKFKDIKEPNFEFPESCQINSEGNCFHLCHKKNGICKHKTHNQMFPSAIKKTFDGRYRLGEIHYDSDLIILLLCGIGVWSKNINNDYYKEFVLEYASQGKLAYVIADETICFGTNYPFTRVFIDNDFANQHSMETIMQVIARGGRLGLSYEASAYLPDCLISRFCDYVKTGRDTIFDEGKNICNQVMTEYEKQTMKIFDELQKETQKMFDLYSNINKKFYNQCKEKIEINIVFLIEANEREEELLKFTDKEKESADDESEQEDEDKDDQQDKSQINFNIQLNKNDNQKVNNEKLVDEWDEMLDEILQNQEEQTKTTHTIKTFNNIQTSNNWRNEPRASDNRRNNSGTLTSYSIKSNDWRDSMYSVNKSKNNFGSNWRENNTGKTYNNENSANNEKYVPPSRR